MATRQPKSPRMSNADKYQMFTADVLKKLDELRERAARGEKVKLFWQRPWIGADNAPRNLQSGRPYHGFNVLVLAMEMQMSGYTDPRWTTMPGANKLGGRIRKGESPTWITLWKKWRVKDTDPDTGEVGMHTILILKAYKVWNVEQCDWPDGVLKPWQPERPDAWNPREEAERVIADYLASPNAPTHSFGGNRAFYSPFDHHVRIPDKAQFRNAPGYYSTEFHELVHSTGHESLTGRVKTWDRFGSEPYAREELVAEIGAGFLTAHVGIDDDAEFNNTVAYIDSWRKALSDDPKLILQAAAKAQQAADRILGIMQRYEDDTDNGNGSDE